eukprot:PhF_6_TR30159/c0_g1_i1/m.44191/K09527/DNAJC7; DnaJ homolog subfamily C member 7
MDLLSKEITELSSLLVCNKCQQKVQDPVMTDPCQHTFCKICLQLDTTFSIESKCPRCQVSLEHPYFTQCSAIVSKLATFTNRLVSAVHSVELLTAVERVVGNECMARASLVQVENAAWSALTGAAQKVLATNTMKQQQSSSSSPSQQQRKSKEFLADRNPQQTASSLNKRLKSEADTAYENGYYQRSIALYSKALEVCPAHDTQAVSSIYANRSAALFMLKKYKDCLEDCEKVLNPNQKIFMRASKCHMVLGDLQKALDLQPDSDLLKVMVPEFTAAIQLQVEGNWGASIPKWQNIVKAFPECALFLSQLCLAYYKVDAAEKAMDALIAAIHKSPTFATDALIFFELGRAQYYLGWEHFKMARRFLDKTGGQMPEALQMLETIRLLDQSKQRGNDAFSQRNWKTASEEYTEGLLIDPSNPRVSKILFCNRAAAYKELGNARCGVEDCTKALQIDASFTKAYLRRARCYMLLEDLENAHKDFISASRLEPDDRDIQHEVKSCEAKIQKESNKDYYEILGIGRNVVEKDMKAKYRELSLRWHPDKCMSLSEEERQTAEKKFKLISEAYSTLSDATKRREYDLKMDRQRLRASFNVNMDTGAGYGNHHHHGYPSSSTSGGAGQYHAGVRPSHSTNTTAPKSDPFGASSYMRTTYL